MNDELKQEPEKQDLGVFQKFYNFMFDCKQKNANDNNEKQFMFDRKIKFDYDRKKGNLVPTNDINNINLITNPAFCCIDGFAIMFSQEKDGKTNIYAVNSALFDRPKEAKIQDRVFKIKDVPVDKAKKFLSSFAIAKEPSEENNFAKQVKNELDFKCVFSEITENDDKDNKQNIEQIVEQNQERIKMMGKFKEQFKGAKLQIKNGFSEFKITGFKDNEEINLRYNSKGDTYMLDKNYDKKASNLDNEDYYFGQYDLLMACTKSNNGKVNVFATNATVENPFDNNNNNDIFAVYNVTKKEAETFIGNLNTYYMNENNYNIIKQEKFEEFFQDHCQVIKFEKDDGKGNKCCFGLFNCCGASKTK